MKIITLHCDYIKYQALKKAVKDAEELLDKDLHEVGECLVVLTAAEKGDSVETVNEMVAAVVKTAGEVKAKNVVLYPYAHLSSNLSSPKVALELLVDGEAKLKKEGFEVSRAPFGYYKSFELKCKGHPLSELSKEFGGSGKEVVTGGKVVEEEYDIKNLLKQISRSKLDTSKLKDNDHRILGQKLDLFSFNEAAPGMVFWHDNGLFIFNQLVDLWRKVHRAEGYQEISTPQVCDNKLWKISGHWGLYKENMYITSYEDRDAALKPMNCPCGMLVYKTRPRSYRELPLRIAELGKVHRKELSGVLSGLFRVNQFTQDDAHIFCKKEDLQKEIVGVIRLFTKMLDKFGFEYKFSLSVRSKEKAEKYLGDDKVWKEAEEALSSGLENLGHKFERLEGEAKFYGPSLDVIIKDSLKREWQCSTLQLDFNLAPRFELEYAGEDGEKHTPMVLHRVVYGSMERFIGVLLEHTNGNLPLWLSPRQVRVVNFTDRNKEACAAFVNKLRVEVPDLRVETDFRSETVQAKVRDAEMLKTNYVIVIGDKEQENYTLAVRARGEKPKFGVGVDDFVKQLKNEMIVD